MLLDGLPEILPPVGSVTCLTEELFFTPGRCTVDLEFRRGATTVDYIEHAGYFDIETADFYGTGKLPSRDQAASLIKFKWLVENE
jgi:lipopolysaccharide transport system ATP-binding protein